MITLEFIQQLVAIKPTITVGEVARIINILKGA